MTPFDMSSIITYCRPW